MRVVLSGRLTTVAIGTAPDGRAKTFVPGGRHAALQFIRGFTHDVLNRDALRRLLSHQGVTASRLDDNEIAAEVATRLATGRLFVVDTRAPIATAAPARPAGPRAPAPTVAPARPQPAAPSPRSAPEPVIEESTFGAIDQDEQAAVLERAADEGVPFCEECERLYEEAAVSGAA